MIFVSELEALEADMGDETEADGVPSYLQPDNQTDYDEISLPSVPMGQTGAPPGRVQVKCLDPFLSFKNLKCFASMS